MLQKVISGGQTGADRAALIAAKATGYPTGGWMPKGFLAQDGLHPEFKELYGMSETSSPHYPPRTALNVKESDGTICFARDWQSRGEILTARLIQQYQKHPLKINCDVGIATPFEEIATWIKDNRIRVLNVAGNSERTAPGIQLTVECYLIDFFHYLKSEDASLRVEGLSEHR